MLNEMLQRCSQQLSHFCLENFWRIFMKILQWSISLKCVLHSSFGLKPTQTTTDGSRVLPHCGLTHRKWDVRWPQPAMVHTQTHTHAPTGDDRQLNNFNCPVYSSPQHDNLLFNDTKVSERARCYVRPHLLTVLLVWT